MGCEDEGVEVQHEEEEREEEVREIHGAVHVGGVEKVHEVNGEESGGEEDVMMMGCAEQS